MSLFSLFTFYITSILVTIHRKHYYYSVCSHCSPFVLLALLNQRREVNYKLSPGRSCCLCGGGDRALVSVVLAGFVGIHVNDFIHNNSFQRQWFRMNGWVWITVWVNGWLSMSAFIQQSFEMSVREWIPPLTHLIGALKALVGNVDSVKYILYLIYHFLICLTTKNRQLSARTVLSGYTVYPGHSSFKCMRNPSIWCCNVVLMKNLIISSLIGCRCASKQFDSVNAERAHSLLLLLTDTFKHR